MKEKSTDSEMSGNMRSLCENQAMVAGVNMERGERIRGNHSAYDKGRTALWSQRSHSLSKHGKPLTVKQKGL